jgi:glycine cleavage system aminomethyltransferase T
MGYITRTAFSPVLSAVIAMGYVRREKSDPGSQLSLSDNRSATVIPVIPSPVA